MGGRGERKKRILIKVISFLKYIILLDVHPLKIVTDGLHWILLDGLEFLHEFLLEQNGLFLSNL